MELEIFALAASLSLGKHSVFRIPYSVFRIPYSVFRIPYSVFRKFSFN
ncbi:hypothetical protein [Vibrio rhodolitus]|nr:hypothetical protein [Vibrio rhodolitus]